ncbi:MAG: hypothetical protein D4R80_00070, partial [Deltaproteobacteria bacterium]
MGAGPDVGSDRHHGRCQQRAVRDVLRGGGRHAKQFPRHSGGHREKGTVLFVLLRPGEPLLV